MKLKDAKHGSLQVETSRIWRKYTDTYAPVIEWTIVRLFLYLSCVFSWEKVQVDLKTAFLNRELDEEMYVRTPRGIAGWPFRMKRLYISIFSKYVYYI
jgi:Reverse transcriptase (RNA-dependent DNA polymerase)